MRKELSKIYDPKGVEDRIYNMWEEGGYFRAEIDPDKKPFTVVIPPPNVTGQLHMGHALDETWQDILVRYKRMSGFATLWLPGTDHAGIATQIRVEEELRKTEGKSRYDYGREAFVERVWDWKHQYGSRITNQLRRLGSSCDWSRERFTLDEGLSKAVRHVFVDLYNKGLIYKGNRIINWCPDCETALSDTEVEHEEENGHFYYVYYPVKDSDERVLIATTRPETMLGDTAVAVNPNDARFSHLIGKTLILPLMDREIPVVADDYVDMEFGTGCVKITPCHDPNDFEIGKRHNLPEILVMDGKGRINENGGKYEGLDRYEARKQVLLDLESLGLLAKVEDHAHNVGHCYRCGVAVEPLTSAQWFVKMKPLAGPAAEVVRNGTVKFVPERFSKIYLNWMENVHDWCISRQLWWGHRIPAFNCLDCGEMTVSETDITVCPTCGSKNIAQEEDVLDTWFSSGLWPFSTLGFPEKTADLDYFFPTDVLVTGYDIIFFWVARMVFLSLEHMKREPFHTVLIHGLVRAADGRKMSKSLGNGVDPLDVIDEYGADALRMTLVTGNSPGNDMRFTEEKTEAMRNFANKLWNASRFVLMNVPEDTGGITAGLQPEDKWILSKFNTLAGEIQQNLEKYELGLSASKIYDFLWSDYCDWYIELVKPRLVEEGDSRRAACEVLCHVLRGTLALLHPFMPFITEEIYAALPGGDKTPLIVTPYPRFREDFRFSDEETSVERVMGTIRAVRNRRAEMNVPPSKKAPAVLVTDDRGIFLTMEPTFKKLAYISELTYEKAPPADLSAYTTVAAGTVQVFMPTSGLVNLEEERARLAREIRKVEADLAKVRGKLGNPGFTGKAPPDVVAAEREREAELVALAGNLQTSLQAISS